MNHAELVEKVAEVAQTTKADAARAVDAVVQTIVDALKGGEEVRVTGLGIFDAVVREARPGRNPRTGEASKFPPARHCVFGQEKLPKTN
jgi:DNA-binding protein HU-beta